MVAFLKDDYFQAGRTQLMQDALLITHLQSKAILILSNVIEIASKSETLPLSSPSRCLLSQTQWEPK